MRTLEELMTMLQPEICTCPECGATKQRIESYTCDLMNCDNCGASLSDKGLKINTDTPMGNNSNSE